MVCPPSLKILLKNVENLSVHQSCLSFKYNNARKQKHPIPLQFVINITILVTVLKLWWIAGSPQRKGKKKKKTHGKPPQQICIYPQSHLQQFQQAPTSICTSSGTRQVRLLLRVSQISPITSWRIEINQIMCQYFLKIFLEDRKRTSQNKNYT